MIAELCESPKVYTIDAPTANTEYSLPIDKTVKAMRIQARDSTDFRLAFEAGKVATSVDPFHTVKGGLPFEKNNLYMNKPTIYVATSSASKKIEVLIWE